MKKAKDRLKARMKKHQQEFGVRPRAVFTGGCVLETPDKMVQSFENLKTRTATGGIFPMDLLMKVIPSQSFWSKSREVDAAAAGRMQRHKRNV
ncbi:hypothetical protein E2C01_033917 [Portunus trituberculatus]|uniref:Uncharacterized protein n=1 Tax=Portunus trituberculatus TaxID=210409 RepID=A0A5B7F050_PORTR|nr:hypothetical protein [Portunus trituberculatus]